MQILAANSNEGVGALLVAIAALVTLAARWLSKKIDLFDTKNTQQHLDNQVAARKIAVKAEEVAAVGENTYSLLQSIDHRLGGVNEVAAKMHEDIGAIRQWQVDHSALHARMEIQ